MSIPAPYWSVNTETYHGLKKRVAVVIAVDRVVEEQIVDGIVLLGTLLESFPTRQGRWEDSSHSKGRPPVSALVNEK